MNKHADIGAQTDKARKTSPLHSDIVNGKKGKLWWRSFALTAHTSCVMVGGVCGDSAHKAPVMSGAQASLHTTSTITCLTPSCTLWHAAFMSHFHPRSRRKLAA